MVFNHIFLFSTTFPDFNHSKYSMMIIRIVNYLYYKNNVLIDDRSITQAYHLDSFMMGRLGLIYAHRLIPDPLYKKNILILMIFITYNKLIDFE